MTAEGLVASDQRYGTNRHNPYFVPGGLADLSKGLKAFDCSNAGNQSPPAQQAPPCRLQSPQEFQGRRKGYPHVRSQG